MAEGRENDRYVLLLPVRVALHAPCRSVLCSAAASGQGQTARQPEEAGQARATAAEGRTAEGMLLPSSWLDGGTGRSDVRWAWRALLFRRSIRGDSIRQQQQCSPAIHRSSPGDVNCARVTAAAGRVCVTGG
jgi:hypothetical protein